MRSTTTEINKNDAVREAIDPRNDVLSETGVSWTWASKHRQRMTTRNDVLSETGVSWVLVGQSVKGNSAVENIAGFFKVAKDRGGSSADRSRR